MPNEKGERETLLSYSCQVQVQDGTKLCFSTFVYDISYNAQRDKAY